MTNNITSNSTPGPQNPASETATIFSTWLQPLQLSDGNGAGTIMGQGVADLLQFFSNYPTTGSQAPISQPSGGFSSQATAFALGGGSIGTLATSQSPVSVSAGSTTREVSVTLLPSTSIWTVGTGDIVYVNKPTAQAGLGMGNVRVSATNVVGLTFSNVSTAATTPTAGEKYGFVVMKNMQSISQTLTPISVAAATTMEQTFSVAGLTPGHTVQVIKPTAQTGLDIGGCRVVSNGVLGITYLNTTAATPITPTAESYTIFGMGGLGAYTNTVLTQPQLSATSTGVVTQNCVELSVTLTGLATTDTVMSISKPTSQAVMPVNGRVSAANVLAIGYFNISSAVTSPAASEVYGVTIYRPSPAAPAVGLTAALTPSAVASQTSAEQIFTVTGVVASSMVWVNKPTCTNGIAIGGVRATSNANQIGINFINATSASITPPAETYKVMSFQQPVPDVNVSWTYGAMTGEMRARTLLGSIRDALVNLGLVAST